MTSAIFGHRLPITEEEFLALGETADRIELFDWNLYVTPAPTPRHQYISSEMMMALRPAARKAGLIVHEAVNVRLRQGRIPIPDLTITDVIDFDDPVIDAGSVTLVCEIVPPSNASADKVLKMHYYADAGIPWYLLIDTKARALRLYHLEGNRYLEETACEDGEPLKLTEPVVATIDLTRVLPSI
jgi:Uma2 family endonuclease